MRTHPLALGTWLVLASWLVLPGCGEESASPAPSPTPDREREPTPPVDPAPQQAAAGADAPEEPAPAEPAEPVDLLHAVASTVRVSSATSGNLAQVARLFDGDLTTAWNSASEDLAGAFVEVQLPASAEVTGIEMTSGYTQRRGTRDLFLGNHRITRVRVLRDDVELGTYPLDPESRTLQSLPVTGPGGVYRIELLDLTPGTEASWREACVSELRVLGRAAGASAGSTEPRSVIVPPAERARMARAFAAANGTDTTEGEDADAADQDEDEGEDADEGEAAGDEDEADAEEDEEPVLASDPAAGAQIAAREGLFRLTELALAPAVENRQPVEPRAAYSRAADNRVFCFVRLENPARSATTLTMRWERVDAPDRGRDQTLDVPAQSRYVTWGMSGTAGRSGQYRCVIRDAGGDLLGSIAYDLGD